MTTKLFKIDVQLSPNQKKNLSRAYHKRETITLRLSANALSDNDTLHVPQTVAKRFDKNRELKKGMDIKLSKSNIRNQVGESLLTSILSMARPLLPTVAKH